MSIFSAVRQIVVLKTVFASLDVAYLLNTTSPVLLSVMESPSLCGEYW